MRKHIKETCRSSVRTQGGVNIKKGILFTIIVAGTLISGCASFRTSPYGASVQNVEIIKRQNIKPMAVAQFKSSKPGLSSITCRAAGPVTATPSFEAYIEKAFIDELKLAGAFDPSSPIILSGMLEKVDFSSGMDRGRWAFILTLSNNKNVSFTTASIYEFEGYYGGEAACRAIAKAFDHAVEKLISDVIQNPKFKELAF